MPVSEKTTTGKVGKKKRTIRTLWGCPLTKNRTNWCYAMCAPEDGMGYCGRPAGHAELSKTQKAILNYNLRTVEVNRLKSKQTSADGEEE